LVGAEEAIIRNHHTIGGQQALLLVDEGAQIQTADLFLTFDQEFDVDR
jgi:hypothetical protein